MNVLAIGCHPDDIEISCCGTLAKCVKRGDRVIVCHVSTGNLGHVIIPELIYTILVTLGLYQIILHVNQRLEAEEKRSASKFV